MKEALQFPIEEIPPENDVETEKVPATNWQMLRDMLTDEGRAEFRESTLNELAEGDGSAIKKLLDELSSLTSLYYTQEGEEASRTNVRIQAIRQRLEDEFPREEVERVRRLSESLIGLDKYGSILVTGPGARKMMDDLLAAAPNKDDTQSVRLFVDLDKYPEIQDGESVSLVMDKDDEPIELPIGAFISADSLANWHGRRSDVKKDGRDSLEVIEDYANQSADTAPEIEDLRGYLMTDGRILFVSGNAHRLAAAIRRGDERVKFRGSVVIRPLDETYSELEPDYEAQSREHRDSTR